MNLVTFTQRWFVLQVRAKCEERTSMMLQHKGYDGFVPMAVSRYGKLTNRPIYPGYVFCKFNPDVGAPLLTTPGIIRILGNGRTPLPVSEQEMLNIHLIAAAQVKTIEWPFCRIGGRVRIKEGP